MLRDGDIVNVPTAQRFYVDGNVRNPGPFVLDPGMTVQQAIALAGGLSDRGSDRGIMVRRLVNGKMADVEVKLDDKVSPATRSSSATLLLKAPTARRHSTSASNGALGGAERSLLDILASILSGRSPWRM